jgi:hydrogenase maturation protease
MHRTLILGYGNPDREDDGVAWHILANLAASFHQQVPLTPYDPFEPEGKALDLLFYLQLTPDLAADFCCYDRICFVDAHTGAVPKGLNIQVIKPIYQKSPFTHHMTPETLLSLIETLYQAHPEAILVSVRGYHFGFSQELSKATAIVAKQASIWIEKWLKEGGN